MFRKVIASVLTFTFLVQSLGFSQIQPLELSGAKPVQIEIPKEFGQIVSAPFAPSKSNFIIHIQDAHGSYEAQQNIENIISYLAKHYKIKTLFLEGGAGKLVPEQFHFFEDRKLDLKVADLLMKRGAFAGAEMFLLKSSLRGGPSGRRGNLDATGLLRRFTPRNDEVSGYGIEDISFYRNNFTLFESAVNAQPQADLELKKLKSETQNQLNRIFSKDARDFMKAWEIHQGENSDWMRYLSVLDNAAQKHLKLDLRNPENQIDFPMLVRYFNLKNRNVDAGKAASERKAFLEFLKGKISVNLYRQLSRFEESENPRSLFESLQDEISKKQIKLPEFQNFIRYAGNRMLQSEMKSKELFTEMNQLSNHVLTKLVTTPEEKKILSQIREHILLDKLARLELTRNEWKEVKLFPLLRSGRGGHEVPGEGGDLKKPSPYPLPRKGEESVFSNAADFYRAAEKRESAFLKNIEATSKKNKIRSAILVTGGFHAEGLDSGLKYLGYSVITIHPNFKDTKNSRKNYLGAMLPETSQLTRALELNAPETFEALVTPRWFSVYRHERDIAVREVSTAESLGAEEKNKEEAQPAQTIGYWLRLGAKFEEEKNFLKAEEIYRKIIRLYPEKYFGHFSLFLLFFERQHFLEAEAICRDGINLHPKSSSLWGSLGSALYEQNRFEEAEEAFRRSIKINQVDLDEDNGRIWSALGDSLRHQKKRKEAAEAYQEAIQKNLGPVEFVMAWLHLAQIFSEQGLWNKSEQAYKKYFKVEFTANKEVRSKMWAGLGKVLYKQKKTEEAGRALQNAIQLWGDSTLALHYLGVIAAEREDWQEAEKAIRRLIELEENNEVAWGNLAYVLEAQEQYEAADNADQRAEQIKKNKLSSGGASLGERELNAPETFKALVTPRWSAIYQRQRNIAIEEIFIGSSLGKKKPAQSLNHWLQKAFEFEKEKKFLKAEEIYRKAIRLYPAHYMGYLSLGNFLLETSRYGEAEILFRKTIELYPEELEGWHALGRSLHKQNRLAESEQAFRHLIVLDKNNASAWGWLGIVLEEQKKWKVAAKAYRKVIQIEDDLSNIIGAWLGLVSVFEKQSLWKETELACKRLLGLDFTVDRKMSAKMLARLGKALYKQKKGEEAERALQRAIQLSNEDTLAWHYLGVIAAERKDWQEAEKAIRRLIELEENNEVAWYNLAHVLGAQEQYEAADNAYQRAEQIKKNKLSSGGASLGARANPLRDRLIEEAQSYIDFLSMRNQAKSNSETPHVFLVLGNPDVRSYIEFASRWKEIKAKTGAKVPIVIAGGRGRGTPGLIEAIEKSYSHKLSKEELEDMKTSEEVTEAGLIRKILYREGVDLEVMRIEDKSTNTPENFVNSLDLMRDIFSYRIESPRIQVVTRPALNLRAHQTGLEKWKEQIKSDSWRLLTKPIYTADLKTLLAQNLISEEEIVDTLGYILGYPDSFEPSRRDLNRKDELARIEEYSSKANPDVAPLDFTSMPWTPEKAKQFREGAFRDYLSAQSDGASLGALEDSIKNLRVNVTIENFEFGGRFGAKGKGKEEQISKTNVAENFKDTLYLILKIISKNPGIVKLKANANTILQKGNAAIIINRKPHKPFTYAGGFRRDNGKFELKTSLLFDNEKGSLSATRLHFALQALMHVSAITGEDKEAALELLELKVQELEYPDWQTSEGASLGARQPVKNYYLLASLIGLAACAASNERPVVSPRQRTESVQPETAPVVSARPAIERPAPREFALRDRPGRRDQIHGWMKSNQIEVDIFRQPRMAISFRTNRPRIIWVQFKNSLRQDLVQSPGGGDLKVELPDTKGEFQTIEIDLKKHLVPGIIDTEAVVEIILGDENARSVEINPIMYEAADGKSLGNSKAALDELAKSYRAILHYTLRRVVLWEGWGLRQWYAWLFHWDQVEEARQKFSGKNLMSPRRWIGSAVIELNWIENGLKNETSVVFSEVSKMHHRLLKALKRNASEEEYGFSAAYSRMTDQIYWDMILRKHDSHVESKGEHEALIPLSDIRDYIYLVRRVIPGLNPGEDRSDSISAASLGRTQPTLRQLEVRFDEICDLLVTAKKYKRAAVPVREAILAGINSVDLALKNARLFEASQNLRRLVTRPALREAMPETFLLNVQRFAKELERLTLSKDVIDWLRRGAKKKERYSSERVKAFDEILQKNYKNLHGEQLIDQMWRSIASGLFGGRHDEIAPLEEPEYEFDVHDVFSSELVWIPGANRYIAQALLWGIRTDNFRKLISAALYLEEQDDEIKHAAFSGGYGPMVWAAILHHYAMLAIYEKNFQRPSSPPTAASSLGAAQIKIPGAVWVPVEMIKNYADESQIERDIAAGFFRREADGSLWAPVIRDPSILHPETLHGRSIHSEIDFSDPSQPFETRVIKGSGLQEAVNGVPYSYDPHNVFESAKFRGGEIAFYSHHAAESALKISAAHKEALRYKDPVAVLAKGKYGIEEEPVLKPLYLIRPLKIPVFRFGTTELLDSQKVLREIKVPETKIAQQAIFIYETPLNDRLNEISRLNEDFSKVPAVYGNPKDYSDILRKFAARLALANYLMHERLSGTFTAEYEDAEDFPPFVSSLDFHNITAAGYIVDLDTVETKWEDGSPEKLQARDEKLARDAIKYFAGKINIPKEIGYQVYDEMRSAGKSTKMEASSLGAAEDLVGGHDEYLNWIGKRVNEGRDPKKQTTALYVGAGADISTALRVTNADKFIFIDLLPFNKGWGSFTERGINSLLEEYLEWKKDRDYGKGDILRNLAAWPFIEKELEIMGAENIRVEPVKEYTIFEPKVFRVEFVWGGKKREIIYVSEMDGRNVGDYAPMIHGGVDFFMMKSGEYDKTKTAFSSDEGLVNAHLITNQIIVKFLNSGGFVIVDSAHSKPSDELIGLSVQAIDQANAPNGIYGYASDDHEQNYRAYLYQKIAANSLGASSLVGGETNLRYLQRIREIVTEGRDSRKKTIALYPASGADISTALLTTDADHFIFVDKMIFDLPGYAVTEEEKKKHLEEYLNQKAQTNYALAVTIEAMRAVKPYLEKELEILGAQNVRISARQGTDNVFDVEFVWNERPRKITFVSGADMRFLPEYQEYLPENGKVDFVIIKAGQYRTFLQREIPRNVQGRLNPAAFPQAAAGGLAGVVIEENGFVISDNPAAMQFSFVQSGVSPVEDARLKALESEYEADFGYDKAYLFRKTAAASSLGSKLEVARVYTNRIVWMPGVSSESLRSALKSLGLFNRKAVNDWDARSAKFNQNLGAISKYLGISSAELMKGVPIILEDSVYRDQPAAQEVTGKLLGAIQDRDLLAVDWENQKPAFISKLRQAANRRFEVKDVQRKTFTDAVLKQWIRRFDVAPIWIGTVGEENTVQISFSSGDKIKLNLDVLSQNGIDPTQVVALLRQIAAQPDKRQELFSRAGFTKSANGWEVGQNFVSLLLNKIYADQAAQRSVQAAA